MNLTGRLGCFFLLIGAGLLGLFLVSDRANTPELNYLVAGAALFLIGIGLWSKSKSHSRPSARFRIFRRGGAEEEDE